MDRYRPCGFRVVMTLTCGLLFLAPFMARSVAAADDVSALSEYNPQVPFCYALGNVRRWPILRRPLRDDESLRLAAPGDGSVREAETSLALDRITVSVQREGVLVVNAAIQTEAAIVPGDNAGEADDAEYVVELQLIRDGSPVDAQQLTLRPAPAPAPISYIADLIDDLIRTFAEPEAGRFRPVTKHGFDQYFRRLQVHGVSRLIVWHSPFPFFTDPEDHAPEHWAFYEGQARAIMESPELEAFLSGSRSFPSWLWVRFALGLRLQPDLGDLFAQSALEHGISLSASFRPFESALTKYYEVPTFEADGAYLWGFLPLAVPQVNYQPERVCFEHYRAVLARMGCADQGRISTIELPGFGPSDVAALTERFGPTGGFQLHAADLPPIDPDSWVLIRQADQSFQLRTYRDIQTAAESRRRPLRGFRLVFDDRQGVGARIDDVDLPDTIRFLLVSHPGSGDPRSPVALDREQPIRLRSRAGNRLNRETIYWVPDEDSPLGRDSRIAGITADGQYRTVFQAGTNSIRGLLSASPRIPLDMQQVVIDRGSPWSVEMLDFQQADARQLAVTQLRTLMTLPRGPSQGSRTSPYDEVFISTRSHVDLAPIMADGSLGQQLIAEYYRSGGSIFHHLGLDKAYAPRSVAGHPRLRALLESPASHEEVERITTWQEGEWRGSCQEEDSPLIWRLARNQAVGEGVTQLLRDLEEAFPGMRIRAVVPPHASTVERVQQALAVMPHPNGGTYGRDYYRRLWCSNNHIPAIGEGMALVDLHGTRVEPVFLGSGGTLVDLEPFERFVDEQIRDLADQRGSEFRGPKGYFYEAQATLRAGDREGAARHRDQRIRHLLSREKEIAEVLLYEAADWLYLLPLSDGSPWRDLAAPP